MLCSCAPIIPTYNPELDVSFFFLADVYEENWMVLSSLYGAGRTAGY
jgi:hypothetical protein